MTPNTKQTFAYQQEAFLRERQAEIDRGEFLVGTVEAIENWEEIVETQGGDEESENSDLDSF